MTIVNRDPSIELDPKHPFYRLQKSIPWPPGAIYAYHDRPGQPWSFKTIADVLKRKIDVNEANLRRKREREIITKRALYVWVFWCSSIYCGWHCYIVGTGFRWSPFPHYDESPMMATLMKLFPLEKPTLFGPGNFEQWAIKFSRKYQRGTRCGKAVIWAEMKDDDIVRVIEKADWPREKPFFDSREQRRRLKAREHNDKT